MTDKIFHARIYYIVGLYARDSDLSNQPDARFSEAGDTDVGPDWCLTCGANPQSCPLDSASCPMLVQVRLTELGAAPLAPFQKRGFFAPGEITMWFHDRWLEGLFQIGDRGL